MNPNILLSCQSVSRNFKIASSKISVLKAIDLEVSQGQMVSIVGASGSGKTTLLNLMAGLDDPSSGSVSMADQPLKKLNDIARAKLRNSFMGFVSNFTTCYLSFQRSITYSFHVVYRKRYQKKTLNMPNFY